MGTIVNSKLYKKDSTGKIRVWYIEVEDYTYTTYSGVKDGRMTPNITVAKPKNTGKKNQTTAEQQALKEAKAKWTKQVERKGYAENLDSILDGTHKPKFTQPMLALDATKVGHRIKWKERTYVAQPKLNGVRCTIALNEFGRATLTSKQGKNYDLHILAGQLRRVMTSGWWKRKAEADGEIYMHGVDLGDVTKAISNGSPDLCFHMFDAVYGTETFNERYRMITDSITQCRQANVKLVPNTLCRSYQEMVTLHNNYVAAGYEGLILRDVDREYVIRDRSEALFKYKHFMDSEFDIVAVEVDKTGGAVLVCKTDKGVIFNSRPMGSDEYRRMLAQNPDQAIGKQATVRYSGLLASGAPEFNRTTVIRDYE